MSDLAIFEGGGIVDVRLLDDKLHVASTSEGGVKPGQGAVSSLCFG